MPDVFVYAKPFAHYELLNHLRTFSDTIATRIAPVLLKAPENIKLRLIEVSALDDVADIHITVERTGHDLSQEERFAMQISCDEALKMAIRDYLTNFHIPGLRKVDATTTVSLAKWTKIWEIGK
ncbi:hypothetical protein A2415_04930 [candidate division WWE3 bacterium RIFOXYC1_FULL_39_7]|uniref:Uncharacterized protein n=2 Tax=Katanobacteria TaxID=422282 RepID=A0A1F4X6S4_UNCKA|nr:MAG: hypothetical protein A2415_04930 [candidate division WWE3 bacterium RIFOXYC1_FULL_39_7]OGC77405.1 MAG: hypothetical protein A2619_03260 [candidate division WWE3 bacterium RIFOXYD1_FULL_39_9]